ncbi:uncharacterized protein LOC124445696 isoform X2 [Xenia sp. Carnegie-2017]|uniref:uncharacterized protein LOC124445696 isoform X2 n=1 Tax=Xenia sp. Carnegie-2017 TaxID=2897299 RepID=UPI001F0379E7|nr:uncharacterized protein LOC124445696 isoform X2 [Xenia sp. Carnegie-2017]
MDYANFIGASDLPVIGYNSDNENFENFRTSGTVNAETVDDYMNPTTGKRGEIAFDLSLKITEAPLTSAETCRRWVNEQVAENIRRGNCSTPCAPNLQLAFLSLGSKFITNYRRFKAGLSTELENFCIFSDQISTGNSADECCYRFLGNKSSYEQSFITNQYQSFFLSTSSLINAGPGHWHQFHPRHDFMKFQEEENRYQECCTNISSTQESCSLFYSVRPICNDSLWTFPTTWGSLYGDPHFVTLDRKNYTFNGCGWYTYFKGNIPGNNKSSLVVQVRTSRVNFVLNATGFTAIAIKEGETETIQVNLNVSGGLNLQVNKAEVNLPPQNGSLLDSGISLSYLNNTFEISTPLGNGVRINVAANGTFFTFVVALLQEYKNSSLGLAGKWNDDIEDEFTLPNGTVLPIEASDSQIFYNFGELWRVPNNEVIYQSENDEAFRCPPNFVPVFINEALNSLNADTTLKEEANKVCGEDVTCLFDIGATLNVEIGKSTIDEITTINNEIEEAENRLPFFIGNVSTINVTLGETFNLVLEAEDPDGDALSFAISSLPNGSYFTQTAKHLNFTWNVQSDEVVGLTFIVTDSKNGSATLNPAIQLCKCQNGACFVPAATSDEVAASKSSFLIMSCACQMGYTGRFCESIQDFCEGGLSPPCHPLVTCTNKPTGPECGGCPSGYEGNGLFCLDVDECTEGVSGCNQRCTNNAGSFKCSCMNGFTLDSDERTCNDINECRRPNDCAQICRNNIGSFSCGCRFGFVVDPNNLQNCIAQTKCSENHNCSQECFFDSSKGETCMCRSGYLLQSDEKTCEDINECTNPRSNLCSQRCQNTIGSYNCICLPGYTLTGITNCEDINECLMGSFSCNGTGEVCENLPGGFRCRCSRGLNLVLENGRCVFQDGNVVVDGAPPPPKANNEQINNAVEITIVNFQTSNYTEEINDKFKQEVADLLNAFCNENELRPQDCGVSQNSLQLSVLNVERLPGYPNNTGNNVTLRFYVDYPEDIRNGTMNRATLGSIVFTELQKLQTALSLTLIVNTPLLGDVTPPSAAQLNNTVLLTISNFAANQWTTLYDRIFRRAVAVTINKYCERDNYTRSQDCLLLGSDSFQEGQVSRTPGYPRANGQGVDIQFYVNQKNSQKPLPRLTLASILAETPLEDALSRKVEIRSSFKPLDPPLASSEQMSNSVVIRIEFSLNQWNYLIDRRLRATAIAPRITEYCSSNNIDCQVQNGTSTSFTVADIQRNSSTTPTQFNANEIDYSFYVNYPEQNNSITREILASIVKVELGAMQSLSRLLFSLQTSFAPSTPPEPTKLQSRNTVQIKIKSTKANQWSAIQDNKFRKAIASQITKYFSDNFAICVFESQSTFYSSQVIRLKDSPVQDGADATYTFFVNYLPPRNSPIQRNFLAGILMSKIKELQTETKFDLMVNTSTLAAPATAAANNNTVIVAVLNFTADQWSAVQENLFQCYMAATIAEFCTEGRECRATRNQVSKSNVHIVQGSPRQNASNVNIEFFVSYPSGGNLAKELLVVILNRNLTSIESNIGLRIVLLTTIVVPPPPTANEDNEANAISIIIKNYQASQWDQRDTLFRENMAEEINIFCAEVDICNPPLDKGNNLTAENIQRLPDFPIQVGNNANLSFYAELPHRNESLPKDLLATIFIEKQDAILSGLEIEVPPVDLPRANLSQEEKNNTVTLAILGRNVDKVNLFVIFEIRRVMAERMNEFCSSTDIDICRLQRNSRRKKRAIIGQTFNESDITIDTDALTSVGGRAVLEISVNKPGTTDPVEKTLVEEALSQPLRGNNLQLTLSEPIRNIASHPNAITLRLRNFNRLQWTPSLEVSFRYNVSKAVIGFCNLRLNLCNFTRNEVNNINFRNVEILTGSPLQNGVDSLLSFFILQPEGSTLSPVVLATIVELVRVLPNSYSVETPAVNVNLSQLQESNLVNLLILDNRTINDEALKLDIEISIAKRLNTYCFNRNASEVCSSDKNFTLNEIITQIDTSNVIRFVVLNPVTTNPISSKNVQEAINGSFTSDIFKLRLSITIPPLPDPDAANAVSILLKDFTASEWSTRDLVFRQKMAEQINVFCDEVNICNSPLSKEINLTAENIQRLPDSPFQDGKDANLSFYVKVPHRNGSFPKNLLATIFTEKQDVILPGIEVSTPPVDLPRETLSSEQKNNTVTLAIHGRDVNKVNLFVFLKYEEQWQKE